MRLGSSRTSRHTPLPKRPYRDSALLYAVFALVIVGLAALTGGNLLRAVLVAAACYVVATGWTWWRVHTRIARDGK